MADREKVLKGLEQCQEWNGNCWHCPYHDKIDISECTANLCKDALALLKEHGKHTCATCKNNSQNRNNGITMCPIEEVYVIPLDGYCHLWEGR